MKLNMILVYGQRSEFKKNPVLSKLRDSLLPAIDEELISYDRLQVQTDLRDIITVRAVGSGMYKAIAVPPTFTLGPSNADRLLHISNLESAIKKSSIKNDRKKFLLKRLPYWEKWAAQNHVFFDTGDPCYFE